MHTVWTPQYREPPQRVVEPPQCVVGPIKDREATPGQLAAMREDRAKRFTDTAPAGTKGCVLVVDDDDCVRETLADMVQVVGYLASQARDAVEALTILRRDPTIVALVTDLTMPEVDGITLISQARAIRGDLPAILLTGYAEQGASLGTVAGGTFHVLRKPIETARLIEQLDLLVTKAPAV